MPNRLASVVIVHPWRGMYSVRDSAFPIASFSKRKDFSWTRVQRKWVPDMGQYNGAALSAKAGTTSRKTFAVPMNIRPVGNGSSPHDVRHGAIAVSPYQSLIFAPHAALGFAY